MTPGFQMEKITHNITTNKYVANNIVHFIMFYCMSHKLNNYVKHKKDKNPCLVLYVILVLNIRHH